MAQLRLSGWLASTRIVPHRSAKCNGNNLTNGDPAKRATAVELYVSLESPAFWTLATGKDVELDAKSTGVQTLAFDARFGHALYAL